MLRAAPSVAAVVVTYNRVDLLEQCLAALRAQTRPPDEVLVVDNASTDGTPALLERSPGVTVLRLPENRGGAGGFHAGIEAAHAAGHTWLWILDDDTIARPDALAELLGGAERAPGGEPALVASRVVWSDGSDHPMNRVGPRWRWFDALVEGVAEELVLLRYATFVSILVHRGAVDRHGLPPAGYFIWSDDLEYTGRLLRRERGFMALRSVVEHRTKSPYTAVEAAGERFYFHVRNTLWLVRGRAFDPLERMRYLRLLVRSIGAYLERNSRDAAALATVARGVRDGLGRRAS